MPELSEKEAAFIMIAAVVVFAFLVLIGLRYATRFAAKREPKSLKAVLDKIHPDFEKARHPRVLTALLSYVAQVERNPVQQPELSAIFTLLAKTHLAMREAAQAFYFSEISRNYYTMFEGTYNPDDETGVLISELRIENDRIRADAKMVLPPEYQSKLSAGIDAHQKNGDIASSNDWIRIRPPTEFS